MASRKPLYLYWLCCWFQKCDHDPLAILFGDTISAGSVICALVMRARKVCLSNSGWINNHRCRRRSRRGYRIRESSPGGNTRPCNNARRRRMIIEFNMYYVTRAKAERGRKRTTADEKFEGDTTIVH